MVFQGKCYSITSLTEKAKSILLEHFILNSIKFCYYEYILLNPLINLDIHNGFYKCKIVQEIYES